MAKISFYVFSIVTTSVLALYLHHNAHRSWKLPPVPSKVMPAGKTEFQSGVGAYAKYSFVLNPREKMDGIRSRQQDWRPIPFEDLTYTRFEEKGFSVVLDCHKCYGDNPDFQKCSKVSGGTLKIIFDHSEWVLGFHHVGAESVFYSEHLPPQELMNWLAKRRPEFQERDFVSLFEDLYEAVENRQTDAQTVAAQNVTCKLVQTFADHCAKSIPN